jgi:hypothetical protein
VWNLCIWFANSHLNLYLGRIILETGEKATDTTDHKFDPPGAGVVGTGMGRSVFVGDGVSGVLVGVTGVLVGVTGVLVADGVFVRGWRGRGVSVGTSVGVFVKVGGIYISVGVRVGEGVKVAVGGFSIIKGVLVGWRVMGLAVGLGVGVKV